MDQRQKEVEQALRNQANDSYGVMLKEWLVAEYEQAKEKLVDNSSESLQGKAQELKWIIKILF